ncbi:MAG TPA: cadherin-like domain-containing protein [Baekduia sp.]|jgi:VCBS repeat-containing protein
MRTRSRTAVVLAATTTAALVLGLPAAAGARPLAGVRVSAPTTPASLTAGARITTTVTVTNARAKRSGAGTLRLYLSAARDTRLAQHAVAALPAHGHAKVTLTGRVPAGLKPGRYRLLVSLDARGTTTKPRHAGGRAVTIKPAAAAPTPAPAAPHTPTAPAPAAAPLGSLANDVAPFVVQADNAPVAHAVTATTAEDTPAAIVPSAADADGDALTYAVAGAPQHGVATTDGATFTYTPGADYHGTDTFTYTAGDGTTDSAPATVTITVTPVNDAPVAVDDVGTLDEDGSETFAWAMVLANDTDADGDPLTGTVATQPAHGTLTETGGMLTYTPDPGYHGTDTFTYIANDGTIDSAPATVSLVVASVNDAPVVQDDSYNFGHNTVGSLPADEGVLANDSDADGDHQVSDGLLTTTATITINVV